jgi:hypothetical protein
MWERHRRAAHSTVPEKAQDTISRKHDEWRVGHLCALVSCGWAGGPVEDFRVSMLTATSDWEDTIF